MVLNFFFLVLKTFFEKIWVFANSSREKLLLIVENCEKIFLEGEVAVNFEKITSKNICFYLVFSKNFWY